MSKKVTLAPTLMTSKKEIRSIIQERLSTLLADYRGILGEKKFDNRIRKTARRLGADIAGAMPRTKKKKVKVEIAKAS